MAKSIWELEEEVRRLLREGVNFEGRKLVVAGLDDTLKWVKLEEGTSRKLVVIYVKDTARVTVAALVRDDDSVDITSVSLDKMCGGGMVYA